MSAPAAPASPIPAPSSKRVPAMSPRPDERFIMAIDLPIDEARQDEWRPSSSWAMIDDIAAAGWSLRRLYDAFHFPVTIATDSVMIVQGGREVASWGDSTLRVTLPSMHKGF